MTVFFPDQDKVNGKYIFCYSALYVHAGKRYYYIILSGRYVHFFYFFGITAILLFLFLSTFLYVLILRNILRIRLFLFLHIYTYTTT